MDADQDCDAQVQVSARGPGERILAIYASRQAARGRARCKRIGVAGDE